MIAAAIAKNASLPANSPYKTRSLRQIQQFSAQFMLPGGTTIILVVPDQATIATLKTELKQKAPKSLPKPIDAYVMKTPHAEGYMNDETQILYLFLIFRYFFLIFS